MFGCFGKMSYLCRMKDEWIITARNRLTGQREAISRSMPKQEAQDRLQRELQSRSRQRYQAHDRLKVERVQPVQLYIQWDEYE